MDESAFDAETYLRLVSGLTLGKRLPQAVYIHAAALEAIEPTLMRIANSAVSKTSEPWNVIKFGRERPLISLLWYPRFFDDGFPELLSSTTVDLLTGTVSTRSYAPNTAPVLHRKEEMLPRDHACFDEAAALTREAEAFGLFDGTRDIGHKPSWEARLARVGLRVVGHKLEPGDQDGAVHVARHRTALTRYSLSSPMQCLWRHGYLDGASTVFDYGCGRGDDVRALQALGLTVSGWDPHFAPGNDQCEADVVNLGFVLNVIEDQCERRAALLGALHQV
jgi:hypothetical protein